MLVIEIPEPTISLNELKREYRNPHKYARERDRWHWLVREQVTAKPAEPIDCCTVTVTRRSSAELDWDNMGGGLKLLMDALVSNKIIDDDKPKVVRRLELQQQKVPRKAGYSTLVEIVPLLDA